MAHCGSQEPCELCAYRASNLFYGEPSTQLTIRRAARKSQPEKITRQKRGKVIRKQLKTRNDELRDKLNHVKDLRGNSRTVLDAPKSLSRRKHGFDSRRARQSAATRLQHGSHARTGAIFGRFSHTS